MSAPSRIQWAGASWKLRVYSLTQPDGAVVEKGFIEHPGAVILMPLTARGELLMLRQYRRSLDQVILELPAGTRGWQEEWAACAQRELREETGYRAQRLTELGDVWPAPGYSDELMRYYLAQELQLDPLQPDFDEEISLAPIPLAELLPMALEGRLQDAKSIIGVLRLAAHLGLLAG